MGGEGGETGKREGLVLVFCCGGDRRVGTFFLFLFLLLSIGGYVSTFPRVIIFIFTIVVVYPAVAMVVVFVVIDPLFIRVRLIIDLE